MKACGYCGRENESAALHCRECGTAFEDVQEESPESEVDQVEVLAEPPVAAALSGDSQNQPLPIRYPVEYWVFLPIILASTGWYYPFVAIVAWYLVLKWMRPGSDFESRMVASGYLGMATISVIQTRPTGDHAAYYPYAIVIIILLACVAFALVCSRSRFWPWALLVISGVLALFTLLGGVVVGMLRGDRVQDSVVYGLLFSLWTWLLILRLRKHRRKAMHNTAGPTGASI
jgi:hypothetical protein